MRIGDVIETIAANLQTVAAYLIPQVLFKG